MTLSVMLYQVAHSALEPQAHLDNLDNLDNPDHPEETEVGLDQPMLAST